MKVFAFNFAPINIVVRFIVTGSFVTVVNLVILYILTDIAGIWYLISSIISFSIATLVSFGLQKWWTFQNTDTRVHVIQRQASIQVILSLGNIVANAGLLYVFTDILGLWYLFSQIIVSGLLAIINFFIYRFYIFKEL